MTLRKPHSINHIKMIHKFENEFFFHVSKSLKIRITVLEFFENNKQNQFNVHHRIYCISYMTPNIRKG